MILHPDGDFVLAIFLFSQSDLGQLDHFERGSVLKETVALKNEAITVPVLATMHCDAYGLSCFLKFQLISTFLKIWQLYY